MDYLDQKNYVTLEEATEENLCRLMDQASSNRFWETKEDSIVRLRELGRPKRGFGLETAADF